MPDTRSIERRASFDFIRYSNVWEDADILCRALGPGARGRRLLSIASAGDNALALLTLEPQEVVAADLNPAQLACLELRIVAFQSLSYEALLAFLGQRKAHDRAATYQKLRSKLGRAARDFWDAQAAAIEAGILHAGKLEGFLQRYRRFLNRWVHSPAQVRALLLPKDPPARQDFYNRVWNTWAWRLLNRLAFSRSVLGSRGRDPEFFRHAGEDVTSGPSQRLETMLAKAPLQANPYLGYQLTGNYPDGALPRYLRPRHYALIRRLSPRIRPFLGKVEDAPGRFYGFNLSNIFEYMDAQEHARTYGRLLDKALPGGSLAYWNLHVLRDSPAQEKDRVTPLKKLSQRLHQEDRYWAYRSFHVDRVKAA
jgi:S-adenosylmethionine-diacylglycerol 3-amino-3-carboxypropyl transferase